MSAFIRFITPDDYAAVLAIYAPFVANTAVSFEYEVPSSAAFADRIEAITDRFPFLVCEIDKEVVGYAYASKHRDRTAYQWSVESSVYVRPDAHRRGVATALYTTLFALLQHQEFINVYAGITQPNERSVAFHRSLGFQDVGLYENIGYKFGQWHSVLWLSRTLQPHSAHPTAPISIQDVLDTPSWFEIVHAGSARVKLT